MKKKNKEKVVAIAVRFSFSKEQRHRLIELGVSQAQLEQLELACSMGRGLLKRSPSASTVRDRLTGIGQSLFRARKQLVDLESTAKKNPISRAALQRLYGAVYGISGDIEVLADAIERAPAQLETLIGICDAAIKGLPPYSRDRTATPEPVEYIWLALTRAHDLRQGRMTIKLSLSGPFREIVGICYEAMTGEADADPERAIRSFLQIRKEKLRLLQSEFPEIQKKPGQKRPQKGVSLS